MRASLAVLAMWTVATGPLHAQEASAPRAILDGLIGADMAAADSVANRGLADGLGAVLAPEGILLFPGAPLVSGRGPVHALLAAQHALAAMHVTWQPLEARVSADTTLGITWGVLAWTDAERPAPRFGRYIAAWRRVDDRWQLAAVMLGQPVIANLALPPTLRRSLPGNGAPPSNPISAADAAFGAAAGHLGAAAAFAEYVAPDGAILRGTGEIVRGPDAVRAAMAEGSATTAWAWTPVHAVLAGSGDLGFTVGEATIKTTGANPQTFTSKYLTVWGRQPDGSYRFLVDGGNARPATP